MQKVISILIVDDQPANLILMKHFVGGEDFNIVTANGGKEALEVMQRWHFDVVFLDIMMPGMNGIEVLKTIKADPELKHTYVIMVSAIVESEELAKALELGASDYIKRPINKVELIARLNAIIRIKRQEDELRLLNDELIKKNKIISESIKSASIIQKAMFPRESVIQEMYPGSFIYFKPKAIVSGDFFWLGKVGDKEIVIEADCTGHGVAGAMLAIIANIVINQIVTGKQVIEPTQFLRQLNIDYSEALNRYADDIENYLLDGMDISVCLIDRAARRISFAAACQTIVVIEKNGTQHVVKGDEYSIGYEVNGSYNEVFTQHDFDLNTISGFIFFSDGIIDQHGGADHNSKFGQAQLQTLIEEKGQLGMHSSIAQSISQWQNNTPQTDDILYMSLIL